MNKRKMTSIALVAAVAIYTVQLAYPADVFAHEQVNETRIENVREVENNTNELSRNSQKIEVSSEDELRKAIEEARGTKENPTLINVVDDIEISNSITIPVGKNIVLEGVIKGDDKNYTSIKFKKNIELPESVDDLIKHAMFSLENSESNNLNSFMEIKNITLDANEESRIIYLGDKNKLQIENGSILQNGKLEHDPKTKLAANSGAAVYMREGSSIEMNGGIVKDNFAGRYAGGFYGYTDNLKINISSGKFENNVSGNYGAVITVPGNKGNEIYLNDVIMENNTVNSNVFNSSDIFIGRAIKMGISGKTEIKNNDNQKIIHINNTDKKNIIYLTGKFYGNINLKNTNLDKNIGTIYAYGTDNYKITAEDASYLDKNFTENEMLNIEDNNLVLRNATKVTFDPNGGDSTENKVQKVAKNNSGETTIKSYLLENTFTKEGKAFLGWSTTPDGEVEYEDGAQISTDKEMTLYAKWGEAVATVNGVGYASVQKAIDKARKEDTVSIIKKDIELEDAINIANKEGIIIDFHNANVSMKNATQKGTVKSLINIINSKNIKIVNANLELSKDERGINVAKGSDVTVAETKFITDKVASEAPKSAILVEDDAKVTISGKVSTEKESTEGKKETFPVVELTDKTSEIRVDANSIINGHEIPSIGEVGTNSGSNDIVFDNNVNNDITLDDVLNDILGDKTNEQIVAKIVEETTTNSIKINTWDLGLKDEVYGIVETKNATNNNRITQIKYWKEPEGKFVTFDGLSSGKEYTIYIKGNDKDNAEVKIEKIVPSVKTKVSSGGGSVTPSIPSNPSKPSKPVYTHKEVIGANRYETAAKVADELGSYDNVVLVNATSTMSDGLAASGLAGKENGAILLTKKDSIPKATMDRIKKVKKVYIIGGENAISQKVANQITAANIKVERIGGKNRVETSELVAEKLGNYSNAFIVNGFKGEADAMSASAIAARYEAPILLTNGKTSTHAKKSGVEYYVIGGNNVVDKSIATKYDAEVLAGSDRYATNREVINEFYSGSDKLYLANGDKLVDALTASPLAKNHGIVLVNKKSDKSILKDKNTVQVGGMDFEIDFE